jgi:hypothetical protein
MPKLTSLEARVLKQVVEAAVVDRTIPLSELKWTTQEKCAIVRAYRKLGRILPHLQF